MLAEKHFLDQLQNVVSVSFPPTRIVSLVPSQTEFLFSLELDKEVIAITNYCIHPSDWRQTKKKIGGTKNFDVDLILDLKPDLIVANKEENDKSRIEYLKKNCSVWISDVNSLTDAYAMMYSIGNITDRSIQARTIVEEIKASLDNIKPLKIQTSALYLIWRKPWMAAGSQTFINGMLQQIGFTNALKDAPRYPELSSLDIGELNPDYILLSSEPFPFSSKHVDELSQLAPHSKIILVDGEMFSWYGSRLIQAGKYFQILLNEIG